MLIKDKILEIFKILLFIVVYYCKFVGLLDDL